jgi:hypothetical protein
MAHTAPPTNKHRRTERILGVLLALVGLVVAAVAVVALNHPKGRNASTSTRIPTGSSSESSPSKRTSASKTAPHSNPAASSADKTSSRPSLIVLDNSNRTGVAQTAAARFRAGGWMVTSTGNFTGAILSTAAYYDATASGAQAAAQALQTQFPAIKRVKEKFIGLPEGAIVVVLTTDYS